MADLIKLTYSDLETVSGSFRTKADDLNTMINELSAKMSELEGTWQGETKEALYEQFETCKQSLAQFPELMVAFAERLDAAAQTMKELDSQGASSMRGNA